MTDRHAGYIVVLAEDVREDDAEEGVLNAIRMLRGVASVQPVTPDASAGIIEARADMRWQRALMDLVRDRGRGK